jgi:aminopeptidase N
VSLVLGAASRALSLYADPDWAASGWRAINELCRAQAYAADPGRPLQLTWVRSTADAARTPQDAAVVSAWYAGEDRPDGLVVDADLRWRLLEALVRNGAAGEAEIDAEVDRDRSVGGAHHSMMTRAQIADPALRPRVWQTLTSDTELPLETRVYAAYWYAHPALAAVTPDHMTDYLSILDSMWAEQGREFARAFANHAFPRGQVSEASLAAIDAWQAEGGHAPALARAVQEGRDALARAMRARARDHT